MRINNKHPVFQELIRARLNFEFKYCEIFNKSVAPKKISSEGLLALVGIVEPHLRNVKRAFFSCVNSIKQRNDLGIANYSGYYKYLIPGHTLWLTVLKNQEVKPFVWRVFFKELRNFDIDIDLGRVGCRCSTRYFPTYKDSLRW